MDPPFHSQSRNTRQLARTEFCCSCAVDWTERLGHEVDDLYDLASYLLAAFQLCCIQFPGFKVGYTVTQFVCVETLTPWGLPWSASAPIALFHWELKLMSSLSGVKRSNKMASQLVELKVELLYKAPSCTLLVMYMGLDSRSVSCASEGCMFRSRRAHQCRRPVPKGLPIQLCAPNSVLFGTRTHVFLIRS